jgi:putative membrane protein
MFFRKRHESPWLGAGAGLIGGLAGSFAIGAFSEFWAKKMRSSIVQKGTQATERAADRMSRGITGRGLDQPTKLKAASAIHFAFGSLMGAAYGASAAGNRKVSMALGVPFGAAVYAGAHAGAVPALGLSEWPTKSRPREEVGEFLGHLVYGVVTDLTRRAVIRAARAA